MAIRLVKNRQLKFVTPLFLASRPFSSTQTNLNKVYELRTYSIKPECLKQFLSLTNEKFHLRTRASVLHGYWTVELGGINQVVHLWEYDSYDHRASIRAKLGNDQEWIGEYFGKVVSMFQTQENMSLNFIKIPLGESQVIHPEGKGLYELWQIDLKQDATPDGVAAALENLNLKGSDAVLCGAFSSLFGPSNTAVLLWRYNSFDSAQKLRAIWTQFSKEQGLEKRINQLYSKALIPVGISPMQ